MSLEVRIVQTETVFSCSNLNPVLAEWSKDFNPIREALMGLYCGFIVQTSAELRIGYDLDTATLRHGYPFLQEVELQRNLGYIYQRFLISF